MAWFNVALKDEDGYEISCSSVDSMKAAKDTAKYMLTEKYAAYLGTSHGTMGTFKVEVSNDDGDCLFDAFIGA